MGANSFASQVEAMIRSNRSKPKSIADNLLSGCYIIMRKTKSYRLEHFIDEKFMTPHFFILTRLISEELKEQEKQQKEIEKRAKSRKR